MTPTFRVSILDLPARCRSGRRFHSKLGLRKQWIFPPVSLISRVIAHARACKAVGTLVVPMWKSSHFWVLLYNDGKHWNAFVHDWVTLPKSKNLFIRGKAKNHLFGSKDLSFSMVALRLNFGTI